MFKICIFVTIFFVQALATTEWFGDLRAHLNPPKSPAFYDVTYDDIGRNYQILSYPNV